MGKQILIDYDEYLCLERCQNVLKDILEEQKYRGTYYDNPGERSQRLELNMPDSFKEFWAEELKYKNLSRITFRI